MSISLGTIVLVVLVLMLVGAIPSWPHSRSWGYGPSGGLGLVLVAVIVLVLLGTSLNRLEQAKGGTRTFP